MTTRQKAPVVAPSTVPGVYAVYRDAAEAADPQPEPGGVADAGTLVFGRNEMQIALHFVPVEIDSRISSYQGQFRYDPERLRFVAATLPEGVFGDWNEPEPGTIRFAVVSLEGLGEEAAVVLRFRPAQPGGSAQLELVVEEMTGDMGTRNLTTDVVARPLRVVWSAGATNERDTGM